MLMSASITKYHLIVLVLAHGVGLNLGQLLAGHSLGLCLSSMLVFLIDRINFGLKVLWVA